MNPKARTPRSRRAFVVALAAAAAMAVAASSFGAVTIYSNDFGSRAEFKSVRKVAGGKPCDRDWYKKKALGIRIAKRSTECAYEPPVYADGPGGDLAVKAVFKVLSEDSSGKVRRGAFGLVAVRASANARYQLRVFPKSGRWELRRSPGSDAFPVEGKSGKVAEIDKRNAIQLRVTDDTIDAWINGERIVKGKVDPAAAEIGGTAVRLGIGQARKPNGPTKGTINLVRIDLPNP
jgi:hypothetical protein